MHEIHLSSSMVESEFQTGSPGAVSVKQVLVHELQHSMSVDNGRELSAAADRSGNPYEFASTTASEGRASLSMLLYVEMEQRAAAGGPRLNELSQGDRQEVVQGVLQQYLVPVVSPPQDLVAERLLEGVREPRYLRDPENEVWNDVADERTTDYVTGRERYTPDEPGAFPISRSRAHTHRRHGHPLQTVPSAGLIERPQEKNRVDALR